MAALAQLALRWTEIRRLIERGGDDYTHHVLQFLATLHDPYWDHHYTLTSTRSTRPIALVGAIRATEMLANVFFPLSISAHPGLWPQYEKLTAAMTNRRVETAATRLFGDQPEVTETGEETVADHLATEASSSAATDPALPPRRQRWLKRASHQQGLLQIYEDFCLQDDSDCERCTFPERVQSFHVS